MYEYLDLLERKLDAQQKKACCTQDNTIVAAGAGSGKTQVLATRFAWLVMSKNIPVDQILTLTFTDKAASEMYSRIYKILSFFAEHPQVPQVEKQRAIQAVSDFSQARIQTLDSYCSAIVRQIANRYGIRPNFSTGSTDSASAVENLALPFVLEQRNNPAIQFFAPPGKIQHAAKKIFAETVLKYTSIASPEDFFKSKLENQRKLLVEKWNEIFTAKGNFSFDNILASIVKEAFSIYNQKKDSPYFQELKKFLPLDRFKESEILKKIPQPEKLTLENIESPETLENLKIFSDWIAKCNFPQNISGYSRPLRALFNKKQGLPAIYNDKIKPIASYLLEFEKIKELFRLLDIFLAQVNDSKRRTGQLSFSDVTELALKALQENPDLLQQERNSCQKIMIDEFQDNNNKNRDLLFLLNDNKQKLFFVGDDKQSIYKFRGADVSVFKQLSQDLNVEPLQMVFNYRSSKTLLNAFNQIFGGYDEQNGKIVKIEARTDENDRNPENWIFPEKPEDNFAASFEEKNAALKNLEVKFNEGVETPVHFCIYNSNVENILSQRASTGLGKESAKDAFISDHDQICFFIANKILELTGETDGAYSKNPQDTSVRKLQFKDIAILDKSRTHRKELTKYLNRAGIPYTTDAQKNIFQEAVVNDIYSLLRLCVYPSDRNALAAFYTSPFANLKKNTMETVISFLNKTENSENAEFSDNAEISEALLAFLESEEREKYLSAVNLQNEFTEFALSHPLTQTISKLWYQYGYSFETAWNKNVSLYAEQYDLLFELARKADESGKTLSFFVDQLAQLKIKEKSSFAEDSELDIEKISYPMEQTNAVKIMTIHKSKGLEFPVVFVYGCMGNPTGKTEAETVYYSEKYGVTANLSGTNSNYFYKIQAEENSRKEDAEFRRLIYVALTRAEQEAYITGSFSEPKSAKSTAIDGCLKKVLKHYYPKISSDSEFSRGQVTFANDAEVRPMFDFYSIMPVHRTELFKSRNNGRKNNCQEKQKFIREAMENYKNAQILEEETLESHYISPASLELAESELHSQAAYSGKNHFPQLTELLLETSAENFGFNDFGTLAHAYLEFFADNIERIKGGVLSTADFSVPSKLKLSLGKKHFEALSKICIEMTELFAQSECGILLQNSTFHKAEFNFMHNTGGKIVRGIMDLIFKAQDGTIYIIDYKTDEKILPEKYLPQQQCYKQAASEIFQMPESSVKTILFYLRYGKAVDISDL